MDSPSLILITIFTALTSVIILFKKLLSPKLPPGPTPWPIAGNLYQIKPVRFRCFQEWSEKYGPIISVWFGTSLSVVVSSSELAKQVLKENDQVLADRPRNRHRTRFSKNGKDLIWADYGPHYVKVRKVCNLELFLPKRLEALRPIREDEVTCMVESIYKQCTLNKTGKSMVLKNHLSSVAFNMITRLAFGKRFVNSEGVTDEMGSEFKAVTSNGLKLNAKLTLSEHVSWLRWLFPIDEEAFVKHAERRDRLTIAIMDEHARARKESGARQHFADTLLTLRKEYDLSEDTIIGLLWDMIAAGMDTISITVEWAMAELVKNPRVQEKLQEELDQVVGVDRIMTEADIANLPYLQCVVKEALRLHPPTPLMLPHKAATNTKIGGYDIPRGTEVLVNVWAIARDPKIWENPLEFRPERFEEENIDVKGNDFRVLPFGAGRRVCPGAQLGINMVASMLGHLLHQFKWELPEGVKAEEVDMGENPGLVTYMRTPLQAVAFSRLESHLYKRVAVDM